MYHPRPDATAAQRIRIPGQRIPQRQAFPDRRPGAGNLGDVLERARRVNADRSDGAVLMRRLVLTALDHGAAAACVDVGHFTVTYARLVAAARGSDA